MIKWHPPQFGKNHLPSRSPAPEQHPWKLCIINSRKFFHTTKDFLALFTLPHLLYLFISKAMGVLCLCWKACPVLLLCTKMFSVLLLIIASPGSLPLKEKKSIYKIQTALCKSQPWAANCVLSQPSSASFPQHRVLH